MPISAARPIRSFQSRLNRVAEQRAPHEAAKTEVSVIPDWKQNFRYPAALIGAALFGALSVFLARYARFHVMGGSFAGDDPDFTMMIDAGIAFVCAFALFALMRFEGKDFKAAQTFGIIAMIAVMHNFVHAAPGAFSSLFSKQWTAEIVAYSEPGSLYFRGNYFKVIADEETVAEADQEEPAEPRIIRLQ